MSVSYGNLHVDEKYSSILEPNLFYNAIFVPGQTFTDKYVTGPAGGIYVHSLTSTACTVGTPGRDFSDEASADSLIAIVLNNNYQKSKKIYGVQAANVGIDLANEQLSLAISEVKESMNMSGLSCLYTEGTTDSTNTDALTVSNIKAEILKQRTAISKAKGEANVVLCSPDTYATILEAAGTAFTPTVNDQITLRGQIGTWLGMTFVEANGLSESASGYKFTYYNAAGSKVEVTVANMSKVDFIMYNYEALSIINNFEVARIVDSENFAGSKAQVEMNTGFKVTSAGQVRVRKHA